jgi:TrmH family RNA methyltransferase
MITQKEIKYYTSLLHKKYRQKERKFIAEGDKLISEGIISGFRPEIILTTIPFFEEQAEYFESIKEFRIEKLKTAEFQRLTDTKNPQQIIAVFSFFDVPMSWLRSINSSKLVFFDNLSDPGNAGTIIRNCDWFGITDVLLSEGTVELYNPKVIRATMGSLFHLNIYEEVKPETLEVLKGKGYKIICSDIKGEDVMDFELPEKSVIVFSNEAHGPGNKIRELADHIISINKKGKAESLNVASASAVILALLTK